MTMQVSLHDVRHALEDLGRLRFGEMNVEDAIREIVHTTHSIFSVDGAGLMLCDAEQQLRGVAASDQRFAHLEELQIRHGEGPCIEAYDHKKLVGADDLTSDDRWPDFSQEAVSRSVRAVLATPLPYNQDAVGVVAVLSEKARPWSPEGELALLAFTDLAALLIASMMMGEQHSAISQQLQGALDSRQIIEQAKGVLIGTQQISARYSPQSSRPCAACCDSPGWPRPSSWRTEQRAEPNFLTTLSGRKAFCLRKGFLDLTEPVRSSLMSRH